MINDIFGECRQRILQIFPERQLYLRSGGEVHYYVFGTKTQIMVSAVLMAIAAWCLMTMFNLLWGHNPLRAPAKEVKRVEARYQRLLEDSRAKESNARILLAQQREEFETAARNFEEKHATISKFLLNTDGAGPAKPITSVDYASSRILMAPTIRDVIPRQSRSNVIQKASLSPNNIPMDPALGSIDDTQNEILVAAEETTLDRIEKSRAILKTTDLSVDTILKQASFGTGGLYVDVSEGVAITDEGNFGSRIASIKARVAEAEALDNALLSVPFGHPIAADNYRTSSYGTRRDPFTKRPTFHEGIDFGSFHLAPIVATADGKVSFVGRNGGYGKVVEIDHGHGFVTRYAHLNKTYVKRGERVKKGDKIAGMGSTGRSTATHLHYEVHFQGRVYDPDKFLKGGHYVQ